MTLFGTDISEYQVDTHTENPLPMHLLKVQDFSFVTARATIGLDRDPLYVRFNNRCRIHNIPFAAYTYVKASYQPKRQAVMAAQVVGEHIPLMVDIEQGSWEHAQEFISECERIGMNVRSLYLPHWYWEEIGSPKLNVGVTKNLALVQSDYGANRVGYASAVYPGDKSDAWTGFGGKTVEILQFGSRIRVDGYNGFVDGDAYRGSKASLEKSGLFHFWK